MIERTCVLLLLFVSSIATASDRTDPDVLSPVEIRASSGPPMWKYVRDGKTLWVLGDLGVVRKGTKLNEAAVRQRVAESGAVLGNQGLVVGDNVGMFRALTLWPAIRRVQVSANGARLADLLPEDTYGRWQQAKTRYVGRDEDAERLRPMYAAFQLYRSALEDHGLSNADVAGSVVRDAAKANRIPVLDVRARLPIGDARKAVRMFEVSRQEDIDCLSETLDRIEPWLSSALPLADAWAAGDLADVRSARSRNPVRACWSSLTNNAIARGEGIQDLDAHVRNAWRDGLRRATAEHDVVFATIPLRDALDGTGLAEVLVREGFEVEPFPE